METGEIKIDSDDEESQAEADDKAPTNDNSASITEKDKEDTQSTLLIAPTKPDIIECDGEGGTDSQISQIRDKGGGGWGKADMNKLQNVMFQFPQYCNS